MSWRYILAALLVILSLIGLAAMQYYLLHTSLSVEKFRFDREMRTALYQTRQNLQEELPSLDLLEKLYLRAPFEKELVLAAMRKALQKSFAEIEPLPTFSIALYDLHESEEILLADSSYQQKMEKADHYRQFLGSRLASVCKCRPELGIQINALPLYLIKRQGRLIYPSILFLILLLVLLGMFINWLRRLRKLNQRQNDFINHLTHELNTPIFSSTLLLRLLQEANDRKDQTAVSRYTELLQTENKRLASQSKRILELAAWESPKLVLHKDITDLHQLIREESIGFAERVKQRKGKMIYALEANPAKVLIDPAAWREVLRNLLDNALKYQNDPPEIKVKTYLENNRLKLEIADRGPGIPPRERKRIFRKFYRLSKQEEGGYGLGLTYVHRIIKAHGADIQVSSQAGGGTRIIISIKSPHKATKDA